MTTADILNQTITIPITIIVGSQEIELDTLLDSGATGCYIHQAFVNTLKIPLVPIQVPIEVKNVDGILNKSGSITQKAYVSLLIDGLHMEQEVHVTNLGKHRLILGLPWLRTWNPEVDWKQGTLQWRNNREDNAISLINYMEEQDSNLALRIVNSNNHEEQLLDPLEQKELIQVKLLTSQAKMPICATPGSAGFDLISPEAISIPAHSRKLIDTQIALSIPLGFYGRIAPRSGLSMQEIDIGAGVIDSDYRRPVKALLINNGNTSFQVTKGTRMAQLIFEKISTRGINQVKDLDSTERNMKGFGSTGSRTTTLQYEPIEENGAIVQPQWFNIFHIYHEVDELPKMWINTKISHAQKLIKQR